LNYFEYSIYNITILNYLNNKPNIYIYVKMNDNHLKNNNYYLNIEEINEVNPILDYGERK